MAVGQGGVLAVEALALTEQFASGVARRLGGPVVESDEAPARIRELLDRLRVELDEYFGGRRTVFDVPIDLRTRSEWDRRVLAGVRTVAYGQTVGYGELARRIGRAGAARAVGGAVARNPIGILIPCHRVIAGDGTLGGYGGDWFGTREQRLAIKRILLELEAAAGPSPFLQSQPIDTSTLAMGRTARQPARLDPRPGQTNAQEISG